MDPQPSEQLASTPPSTPPSMPPITPPAEAPSAGAPDAGSSPVQAESPLDPSPTPPSASQPEDFDTQEQDVEQSDENLADDEDLAPPFSWEASEFVFHEKPAGWYLALFAAAALLGGGLAWFKQWIAIAMVAVMTLAIITFSRKQPRTLHYQVDEAGITIDGKLHPYELFKSYSLHPQVGWKEIDFEPAKRFSQRLTVLCEEDAFDQIEDVLVQQLPRVDREPDFIEKLSRTIKF